MTNADALRTVIERLEKATGPDRGLDGAIGLAINPEAYLWTPEWWSGGPDEYLRWPDPRPGVAKYENLPRYTESIDAALTLVPEGCGLLMATGRYCKATVSIGYLGDTDAKWIGDAKAPTLALAVCIAALRSRQENEHGE